MLLISGFTALLFHRLHQPNIVGYVLAGLIIGPYTPPFALIQNEETIRTLADIGIVFLMFSLGLDFNLRRLRRVGTTAVLTAILDVGVMVWLGYLLGRKLGWTPVESLFLGAIVCDSSTTILAKVLHDLNRSRDRFAGVAIGITVVEDVLAVAMIAVLTGLAMTGSVQTGLVATRLWHLVLFIVLVTVIGLLTVPRLLNYVHRFRSDELLVVALVGICFGVALLAVRMDLSLALGAVLIGAIASESRALPRITQLEQPLRHVFSAVFFVTIGLRLDPHALYLHWPSLVAVTALVIAGKFITNCTGSLLTGHRPDTSLLVGAGMAQIGEFAFIISAMALSLGIDRGAVYQVGVSAAVVTTLLSPYLIKGADRAAAYLAGNPRGQRWASGIRFYGQWIDHIRQKGESNAVRRAVRRSLLMILVNLILISAVFGVAGYVYGKTSPGTELFGRPGLYAAALWLVAAALSLPLFAVTVRKLGALAMVLAETALPMTLASGWARPVRAFISHAIVIAGGAGLVIVTFILSSTLLPSPGVFSLLVILTFASTFWAHRRLAQVYARAQNALQHTLTGEKEPTPDLPLATTPDLEHAMGLDSCILGAGSKGRTLRSLMLRSRTGVTVVAIEREGKRTTNPDPGSELCPGDRVFLLGAPEQILAARDLLNGV